MSTFTQLLKFTNVERCLSKRDHSLVEILTASQGFDCYSVARWCTRCGAIVVDSETDNRVAPGHVMEMQLPILTAAVGHKLQERDQEHADHASP